MLIISGGGGGAAMGSIDGYVFTSYILVTPYAENIHNSLHCLFVVYYAF